MSNAAVADDLRASSAGLALGNAVIFGALCIVALATGFPRCALIFGFLSVMNLVMTIWNFGLPHVLGVGLMIALLYGTLRIGACTSDQDCLVPADTSSAKGLGHVTGR